MLARAYQNRLIIVMKNNHVPLIAILGFFNKIKEEKV